MAASRSDRDAPAAVISTNVPSSGRARRALAKAGRIERENALDAFGHVPGRERGPRDVANVPVERDGITAGLPNELVEPAPSGDLATIGFSVLQDLHLPDPAVGLEGDGVVDDQMLADHVVDDEEAQGAPVRLRLPNLLAARTDLLPREPLDRLDIGGSKDDVRLDELARRGKGEPLGLFDGQIAMGVGRRGNRHDDRRRHAPSDPAAHYWK